MKRMLFALFALTILFCAACAAPEVLPAPTPHPTEALSAEKATDPVIEPTPTLEPTPSPTPEPTLTTLSLQKEIFLRAGVSVTACDIQYAAGYLLSLTLLIENTSAQTVSVSVERAYINDFLVTSALDGAESIQPAETREATLTVPQMGGEALAAFGQTDFAALSLNLTLKDKDGKEVYTQRGILLENPATTMSKPVLQAVYEDDTLAVYIPGGTDYTLERFCAAICKKEGARWTGVRIDPVYAGYTHMINETYALDAGKYAPLLLDAGDIYAQYGVTQLGQMRLYLSLCFSGGRVNRPITATISDPNGLSDVVESREDTRPIVYQTKLAYALLRYDGIVEYDGHRAIRLDFENITQNYIKLLDITAYPSDPDLTIDGKTYRLSTDCTYAFPTTHGCILLWSDDIAGGIPENASVVTVRLKIARLNAGRLDPIEDTGYFDIPLS